MLVTGFAFVAMRDISKRLPYALKASGFHLIGSVLIASLATLLVLRLWYPHPYGELAGGRDLLWILISVDVVCGPMLTLVLFSPLKSKKELALDLSVVAVVQFAALLYGLYSLAEARPVALVYEVDRFRVISRADIYEPELKEAPDWTRPLSFSAVQLIGIKLSQRNSDLLESMDMSMAGIELSQRPSRWQSYDMGLSKVMEYAQPMSALFNYQPARASDISIAIDLTKVPEAELRWLPLVSRHANDWVVLLDGKNGKPLGFLHVEGFFPVAKK
ncbi:TfpX/TfpZ family type IV pilin accessory protein [Variovorax sp. W6]|uniref:TfpX/TfpZ family type IV pilin accessory protein n=1 Tax=Variovorax sp. W6 TaxID=3093895 RepID=UPI003D8081D9